MDKPNCNFSWLKHWSYQKDYLKMNGIYIPTSQEIILQKYNTELVKQEKL
jgi:hypothetical protein